MQIIKLLAFLFLIVLAQSQETQQVEVVEDEYAELEFNWNALLQCIKDAHPVAKEVLELVKAIKSKDYNTALSLVFTVLKEGSAVIKGCIESFKTNEIELLINWPAIGNCLKQIGPHVPGIATLVAAIVAQNWILAAARAAALVGPAIKVFKKCKSMF